MTTLRQYLLWLAIVMPAAIGAIVMYIYGMQDLAYVTEEAGLPLSKPMAASLAIYKSLDTHVPRAFVAIAILMLVSEMIFRREGAGRFRPAFLGITGVVLVAFLLGTTIVGSFALHDTIQRASARSFYFAARFDQFALKAQVQADYELIERIKRSGFESMGDVTQISEEEKTYRVQNLLDLLAPAPVEDRRRAVGSLLKFSDFLAQNPLRTKLAIEALAATTEMQFDSIDAYAKWFETVRDEPEWDPFWEFR